MISIATDDREIVLIYNANIKNHREIYAYAAAADASLNALDLQKGGLTGTLWSEIAKALGKEVKDLIHTDHSTFVQKHGKNVVLDNNGAIKLLQHEPELFIFPIAIRGTKAIEAKLYSDMMQLFGTDTAQIKIP